MDTTAFIQNMAVILISVGFVSVLFGKLGWPRAIGYILAGVFLGRYTWGGSLITEDAESTINILGQMGVMFLMFTLGLEFSLAKLKKVGRVALSVAVFDALVMIWAGHFVGTHFFGMGTVSALFLGAAICDSATTVLAKTIADLGWTQRKFTGYVMGVTMSEDLLCVAVIAVITGIARNGGAMMDMSLIATSLGGLSLFVICVTIFGMLLIPRTMNWVGRLRDDESLLLCILGFCFLIVFVSLKLDYGVALGAFLVGMTAAGSNMLRRIYRQSVALRSMFSAVFFVTIGLMIDPSQLWMYRWQIIMLSAVVIVGKTLNCTVMSLFSGLDLKNSLQTGMGLAQIGEFALIIAFLGENLNVFPKGGMFYPVVVGTSLLTTMLNAVVIRLSEPISNFAVRAAPKKWKRALESYGEWISRFEQAEKNPSAHGSVRAGMIVCAVVLALQAAVYMAAGLLTDANFLKSLPAAFRGHEKTLLWVAALMLNVPCSIFYFHSARNLGDAVAERLIPEKAVWDSNWARAFTRMVSGFVSVAAVALLYLEFTLFSNTLLPEDSFERWLVLLFVVLLGILGWAKFQQWGKEAVKTLRVVMAKEEGTVELLDVHTDSVEIRAAAAVCGKSLRTLNLRATTGASVVGIERHGRSIVNPTPDEVISSGDRVYLLGDDNQLESARQFLKA